MINVTFANTSLSQVSGWAYLIGTICRLVSTQGLVVRCMVHKFPDIFAKVVWIFWVQGHFKDWVLGEFLGMAICACPWECFCVQYDGWVDHL